MTRFKKRAIIIVLWLVFLALANMILFNVESVVYHDKASEELRDLAVTVADQIPLLLENDYYTEMDASAMEYAKLNALSLSLGDTEDIREKEGFLRAFEQVANIEKLNIYDRDANVVFKSGDDHAIDLDPAFIRSQLNDQPSDLSDKVPEITENDQDKYLSARYLEEEHKGLFTRKTENNKWLLVSEWKKTETKNKLLDYFNWTNVLSRILIGRTGFVLSIDDESGTVLTCRDEAWIGQPVDSMGIRIEGSSNDASFSELTESFRDTDRVLSIRVGGKKYYANRLKEDHTLMLALFPEEEIRENAANATSILVILLFLISGISVLFAFFHIQDTEDFKRRPRGDYAWNGVLAGRLKIMALLTSIILLLSGIYLEALSAYAETFRYTNNRVNRVVELVDDNSKAMDLLTDWFKDEYLTKCRIIDCILGNMAQESRTREFLSRLSESLGVRSIFVYDAEGKIIVTDSPYNNTSLSMSDPFYALLKERPELVGELEQDKLSGECRQKAGITLLNENKECVGLIIIVTDPTQLEQVRDNLGFGGVFEQLSLKDDTLVMSVRSNDMSVLYLAEVKDGKHKTGLNSFDYTGMPVSEMGITGTELRDHYNGDMFVLKNKYFASVRRLSDYFILVMRPQVRLSIQYINMVLIAVICTLIFTIALILVSCLEKKETAISNAAAAKKAAARKKKHGAETADELERKDDDVFTMLGSLINKRKPYFEQRWPEDCIRWKDKTTSAKFIIALRYILMLALTAIFVHALTAGEGSIWYYCLKGQWNNGINLYSLTYCLITVSELFVIKLVLHKILFLTARAVSARGETFCHLLDSFSGYGLAIAGIFICLSHFGVNATTLSLTGGVAGVIFGIGCQNIVADILAGILMAFEGTAYVGDFVSYNDQYAIIQSIGVRTTILRWFGEETIVRNNDFKNFINMPSEEEDRVVATLSIDLNESLERVEKILDEELPLIHASLCRLAGDEIKGPKYMGVKEITSSGIVLSFSGFCKGTYYAWLVRAMNRELKLMCERRRINIAMTQVVVNNPVTYPEITGSPQEKVGMEKEELK